MSRAKWIRDALTGLPVNQQPLLFGENLSTQYSDCNLFCVRSVAAAFGKSERTLMTLVENGQYPGHFNLIRNEWGTDIVATHVDSAAYAGRIYDQRLRNDARQRIFTNPSSGGTRISNC